MVSALVGNMRECFLCYDCIICLPLSGCFFVCCVAVLGCSATCVYKMLRVYVCTCVCVYVCAYVRLRVYMYIWAMRRFKAL